MDIFKGETSARKKIKKRNKLEWNKGSSCSKNTMKKRKDCAYKSEISKGRKISGRFGFTNENI